MNAKQRFIIIDDDDGNNLLSKLAIQRVYDNIELMVFTEPAEGIEYIEKMYSRKQLPTTLFLDINMPGINGWDIMGRLEKIRPPLGTNFITYILSSSADRNDKERASSNKLIKGYIEKPLRNTISNLFKAGKVN